MNFKIFETNFSAVLEDNLNNNTPIILAVSGGADSMAMLASVISVSSAEDLKNAYVMHVEHGIRPACESKGDADFVRDFCKKNNIKCRIVHIKRGRVEELAKKQRIGIEAAARFFRRRALFRYAKKIDSGTSKKTRILIAHTKDDALELALMRVFRGAGPGGLGAMPINRGRILRPLLSVTRKEVIAYLKEKNIQWREDKTNAEDQFLRNRVRNRLVPVLNEFFPSWQSGISGMAKTQFLISEFLKQEAKNRIKWSRAISNE